MLDELSQYGTRLPQMLSIWDNEKIYGNIRKYEPDEIEGFKILFPVKDEIILEPESTEPF